MEPRADSSGRKAGKRVVRVLSKIVDIAVVAILALLFLLGCYALWDSNQVDEQAASVQWQPYKPAEPEPLSFWELQKLNPEVVGWLSVYGTHIDYPLCQSDDINKYLNRNAKGEYALSGALFLDPKCKSDFSDFSTVVYGHHMERNVMFGQLTDFSDKAFFDEHRYGQLYADGRNWGLEFVCYMDADAYDRSVYRTGVKMGSDDAADYMAHLLKQSKHSRKVKVGTKDRIVLLSTCSTAMTNARSILVAKICDNTFENTFVTWPNLGTGIDEVASWLGIPWYAWLAVILWILLIAILLAMLASRRRKKRRLQAQAESAGPVPETPDTAQGAAERTLAEAHADGEMGRDEKLVNDVDDEM